MQDYIDSLNNAIPQHLLEPVKYFLRCENVSYIRHVRLSQKTESECMYRVCLHALLIYMHGSPTRTKFEDITPMNSNHLDAYALRIFITSYILTNKIPTQVLHNFCVIIIIIIINCMH